MLIKYFLITLCCFLPLAYPQDTDSLSVFLVKQRWHTGIVIRTSDIDSTFFPEINLVKHFKYFDAGWGDEAFYRHPDFDLELAVKALFYPTPAALRIEGFNFGIDRYIQLNDQGYEIRMNRKSFDTLCSFISSTFTKKSNGAVQILEKRFDNKIIFYRANGKYTLLNTCNTWVAAGLKEAGLEINKRVVLVEQLFDEIEELDLVKRLK